MARWSSTLGRCSGVLDETAATTDFTILHSQATSMSSAVVGQSCVVWAREKQNSLWGLAAAFPVKQIEYKEAFIEDHR